VSTFKNNEFIESWVKRQQRNIITHLDNEGPVRMEESSLTALAFRYADIRRSRFRWSIFAVAGWVTALGLLSWMVTR